MPRIQRCSGYTQAAQRVLIRTSKSSLAIWEFRVAMTLESTPPSLCTTGFATTAMVDGCWCSTTPTTRRFYTMHLTSAEAMGFSRKAGRDPVSNTSQHADMAQWLSRREATMPR
jgi:hypothetical protein